MPPTVPAALASSSTSRTRRRASASQFGEHLEGERQQRIARQYRHGVAEDFVTGGPAAPQVVVVERRQVVMNQRIGVHQFKRAGRVLHARGAVGNGVGGGHAQDGADALAAGEQAVAHGPMNHVGLNLF